MNYYPFHVGDYTSSTAHLEPMEDLAYRRLIDVYYAKDGQLFGDVSDIARLIRMRSNLQDVEQVINEFFTRDDAGKLCHSRCDEEISKAVEKSVKAKASAQASVSSRKANATTKTSERSTNAQRTLNERSTNVQLSNIQEPISNIQEPITKNEEEREEIAVLTASELEAAAPTFSQAESFKPAKPEALPENLPTTNRQQPEPPQAKVSMAARSLTAELHRDTAKRVPGFTPKFSNYADETAIAELIANGATADHIRKVWAFATSKPFWAGKIATPKDLTRHWVALCQESASAKPPTASQQQAMRDGKPIIDREGWTAAAGEGWYTSWGTKEGWHDGKFYENDCEMMGVAA